MRVVQARKTQDEKEEDKRKKKKKKEEKNVPIMFRSSSIPHMTSGKPHLLRILQSLPNITIHLGSRFRLPNILTRNKILLRNRNFISPQILSHALRIPRSQRPNRKPGLSQSSKTFHDSRSSRQARRVGRNDIFDIVGRNKAKRVGDSGHGEVAVEKGSENVFEEFGAAGGVGVVAFEICGFHPCPGEEARWDVVGEKLGSDA